MLQGELAGLGIKTCGQLKERLPDLHVVFSDLSFSFFLRVSLGLGSTQLEHGGPRKSLGTETTFEKTGDKIKLFEIINELCMEVAKSLEEENLLARTVTLKIKTADFRVFTRAGSFPVRNKYFNPKNNGSDLFQISKKLLEKELDEHKSGLKVRLLGIRVSNLKENSSNAEDNSNTIAQLLETAGTKRKSNADGDADAVDLTDSTAKVVEQPTTYQCPICNCKLPRIDLVKFNSHIDDCLTRSTIRQMKEEDENLLVDSTNSTKPKQPQKNNKTVTSQNQKNSSILHFFSKKP